MIVAPISRLRETNRSLEPPPASSPLPSLGLASTMATYFSAKRVRCLIRTGGGKMGRARAILKG